MIGWQLDGRLIKGINYGFIKDNNNSKKEILYKCKPSKRIDNIANTTSPAMLLPTKQ